MEAFEIGDRRVGPDAPTFVIAEAGSNHNGDLDLGKELIDAAANAGADAVKFQTFRAEKMYPEEGELYLRDSDQTAHDLFRTLEMPYEWIQVLHEYARGRGVSFLSTPFDGRSAEELEPYVPAYKVASSLATHHPLLERLASTGKPIILSTGAKEQSQIEESVEFLRKCGVEDLVVLQCTTAYPTPLDRANLRVIRTLREGLNVLTGLSDHTTNSDVSPVAAVALGANVLEKHLTLDREMEGPDQDFSLEPDEFERYVEHVRGCETALGSGVKRVLDVEQETRTGEPCLHATVAIAAGDSVSEENTAFLRPLDDECVIPPSAATEVLGMDARESIEKGEKIYRKQLQ